MAYIICFHRARGRQKVKDSCYLESDLKLDFEVYNSHGSEPYRIEKKGKIIAVIDMGYIRANNLFVKQVNVSCFVNGWMLNEDKNQVVTFSGWEIKMNNKVIGKLSSGGNILNTIFTLVTKGKFNWPDPFDKVEFDEKVISAEAALSILLSECVYNPPS